MPSASELLKSTGLLPDGPVRWGTPVRSSRPGVFLVELLEPVAQPPIDVSICGKWAERVATLLLDGERPDGKALQRRLAAFWLPSQTVLYVASTTKALNARVGALYANELGARSPHPGGHWLKTVRGLSETRIWWVETEATEEAEDAILDAFAAGVPTDEAERLWDPTIVLPFATLQSATGAKKETGLTGSLLPAPDAPPSAVRRSSTIGSAARPAPRERAVAGGQARTAGRASPRPSAPRTSRGGSRAGTSPADAGAASEGRPIEGPIVTAAGLERLQAELDDLRTVQRPANVQRIKTAREHGDLRENAEYQEARREQGFIEGRIQKLEEMIRFATVAEAATGHEVAIGSSVVVEHDGERVEFSIVGSSEANAALGRISYLSPIGAALIGRRAGDEVVVATPSGTRHYRIAEVG